MDGDTGQGSLHLRYTRMCGRIRWVLARCLRTVAGGEALEDLLAEGIALGWKRFLSLVAAGKRPEDWPWTFAERLARHVRAGKRLAGGQRRREPLARVSDRPADRPARTGLGGLLLAAPGADPSDLAAARLDYARW